MGRNTLAGGWEWTCGGHHRTGVGTRKNHLGGGSFFCEHLCTESEHAIGEGYQEGFGILPSLLTSVQGKPSRKHKLHIGRLIGKVPLSISGVEGCSVADRKSVV